MYWLPLIRRSTSKTVPALGANHDALERERTDAQRLCLIALNVGFRCGDEGFRGHAGSLSWIEKMFNHELPATVIFLVPPRLALTAAKSFSQSGGCPRRQRQI